MIIAIPLTGHFLVLSLCHKMNLVCELEQISKLTTSPNEF